MSAISSDPSDVLKAILRRKAEEVAERSQTLDIQALRSQIEHAPAPRGFGARLQADIAAGRPGVIAEVKRASPSKGIIREHFDPAAIAKSYAAGGASCLSVLTDRDFFQGHELFLQQAREACELPVLRKDFVIDPYQLYEARALGADCVLLIVAALGDALMLDLYRLARELGLDVLVEVHDEEELARALALKPQLLGINNRNLRTFETDIQTTLRLKPQVPPDCLLVTESGIHLPAEVQFMRDNGVHAFLVGESMMRADDPGAKLRELFYGG
jgi:indole-3-glycerol phosphate synthase